ncbi:hypothetical protein [Massilia sp.]|uniref:hypothetical protein n=1 Tax=Massilia sp. TaxID=1882437 RepID=UPI00352E5317
MATLSFEGEQISLPCPTCVTDVYKFRDAVIVDEGPAPDVETAQPPTGRAPRFSFNRHHLRVAVGAGVLLLAVGAFVSRRSSAPVMAVSTSPVLPLAAPTRSAESQTMQQPPVTAPKLVLRPEDVTIADFKATADESGIVKVAFRLTNREGSQNDYPGLAIHWQGVSGADQVIRNDAYAHPAPPFTATDVTLELARPQGATGIDVKIVY